MKRLYEVPRKYKTPVHWIEEERAKKEDLRARLESFIEGNYYTDVDSGQLAEEFETCEENEIRGRIKQDVIALDDLIKQLKKEGLI